MSLSHIETNISVRLHYETNHQRKTGGIQKLMDKGFQESKN
jgi:hypothetical protein